MGTGVGQTASMEPRPEGRGDFFLSDTQGHMLMLQWSHGPKAVETRTMSRRMSSTSSLQWSHGPKAVETPCPKFRLSRTHSWLQWSHGPKAVETSWTG